MRFIVEMFGLDLSRWDEMGFWDYKYRPFSYFSDNTLVSNVSVYSINMTVQGKPSLVAQISAVGTLPEYRRKGLSYELTQKALDWARSNHDFFFLFADEEAYGFYEKCGFCKIDEYMASVSVSENVAREGAVKLDVQRKDHLNLIYRFAKERAPVSDLLGVMNSELFMFWCLYYLKENIHHIPDLDILVLYKRENNLVTISDIVGPRIPAFSELYPYICDENDKAVEFLFMPDKLNLGSHEMTKAEDNGTHILGSFPLDDTQVLFPLTSHA